jgi:hypothetical protein
MPRCMKIGQNWGRRTIKQKGQGSQKGKDSTLKRMLTKKHTASSTKRAEDKTKIWREM